MPPKRKPVTLQGAPAKRTRQSADTPTHDVYDISSVSPPPTKRVSRRNKAPSPSVSPDDAAPKSAISSDQKENAPPSRIRTARDPIKSTRASARKPPSKTTEPVDVLSSGDELSRPAPLPKAFASMSTAKKRRAKPLLTYSTPSRLRSGGKAGAPSSVHVDELGSVDPPTPSRAPVARMATVTETEATPKTGLRSAGKGAAATFYDQDSVPPTPNRAPVASMAMTPSRAPVAMMATFNNTPKVVVKTGNTPRTEKKRTPAAAEQDEKVDEEEEVPRSTRTRRGAAVEVKEDGSPVKKTTSRAKRPSMGRPSIGVEGLADPFAVPHPMDIDTEILPSITLPKGTPQTTAPHKKPTPKPTPKPTHTSAPTTKKPLDLDLNVHAPSITALQSCVLGKITGRTPLKPVGLDEDFSQVHQLLEQTITAGEGNSMLIIGARGSGKSLLVNTALSQLTAAYLSDFHIVRLNGLLQTDDRLALREIWRQLGVEMELDENEQPKNTNFADTLSSILAILSHPDELQGQDGGEDPARTSTSVVFVLDEFDLFASHPRQTLLYNLFDIAQAKKAPIAVLGLTCKVDVVDSLEKRVKSRFSHRTLHLKLPSSLDAYWEIVKEGLSADMDLAATHGGNVELYFETWNTDYLEVSRIISMWFYVANRNSNSASNPPSQPSSGAPTTPLKPSPPYSTPPSSRSPPSTPTAPSPQQQHTHPPFSPRAQTSTSSPPSLTSKLHYLSPLPALKSSSTQTP